MKSAVLLALLASVASVAAACNSDNNEHDRQKSQAAFGSDDDKCARAYARMEPLFVARGGHPNRAAELKRCRTALKQMPGREVWLDCIIHVDGELTQTELTQCQMLDARAIESQNNDGQVHVLGKRSAGSAN